MPRRQIPPQSLCQIIQQRRTDNAARTPDLGDPGQIKRPVKLLGRGGQQAEALRVGKDARGQQSHLQVLRRRHFGVQCAGSQQRFGRLSRLLFGGPTARANCRFDGIGRLAHFQRLDDRPTACSFLPRAVKDHIDHRLAGLGVRRLQRGCTDLDEV